MFHTVYNSYESKPDGRDYIGKHTAENPYDDYRGSFKDESFDPDDKIIIGYSKTPEGAVWLEIQYQRAFKVAEDPQFANRSYQTSDKFVTGFAGEDHPKFGKPVSNETKQKLREANLGKKHTKESRQKMSEQRTGKTKTEEVKRNIREAKIGDKNPMFGKNHTEETKRLQSDSKLGEKNSMFGKTGETCPHFGKKWYINTAGETCMSKEPPGPEWRRGRK
jgi:hypothetical protein